MQAINNNQNSNNLVSNFEKCAPSISFAQFCGDNNINPTKIKVMNKLDREGNTLYSFLSYNGQEIAKIGKNTTKSTGTLMVMFCKHTQAFIDSIEDSVHKERAANKIYTTLIRDNFSKEVGSFDQLF